MSVHHLLISKELQYALISIIQFGVYVVCKSKVTINIHIGFLDNVKQFVQSSEFASNAQYLYFVSCMHIKYREAAINLSKQGKAQVKPDPLSSICHEKAQALRRAELKAELERRSIISITEKSKWTESLFKGSKLEEKHRLIKKEKKKKHRYVNAAAKRNIGEGEQCWQKYLPKEEDEFQEVDLQRTKLRQKVEKQKIASQQLKLCESKAQLDQNHEEGNKDGNRNTANEQPLEQKIEQTNQAKPVQSIGQKVVQQFSFDMASINIQSLKKELGILVEKQQVRPKIEEAPKPQIVLNDYNNSKACKKLPFAGRAFEQAPPKPEPKMIHEYAPTCKVAGLYAWPPPRTQHRMWRKQMRQSRKLK